MSDAARRLIEEALAANPELAQKAAEKNGKEKKKTRKTAITLSSAEKEKWRAFRKSGALYSKVARFSTLTVSHYPLLLRLLSTIIECPVFTFLLMAALPPLHNCS
jgi:hypothetical protein